MLDDEYEEELVSMKRYEVAPIADQVDRLKSLLPELEDATYDATFAELPLPQNAEGWYAIPRFRVVTQTYNSRAEKIESLIYRERNEEFMNWIEIADREKFLRQSIRSVQFWKRLGRMQRGHNILIIAAQFGQLHLNCNARTVRANFQDNEFGLGILDIGVMLLTHPKRLIQRDDPSIDCVGDEYDIYPKGTFSYTPRFGYKEKLELEACRGGALAWSGSASAFLPQ